MILINKIFIIIYSIFLFIPLSSYAIDIVDSDSSTLSVDGSVDSFSKKLVKFDVNPYSSPFVFNIDCKLKSKLNKNTYIINNIKNEFHFNLENSDKIILSKLNLGYFEIVHDKYGSFSYGRNYGVMQNVLKFSDVTPYFKNYSNKHDHFMFNIGDNLFSYKNDNLFGLSKRFKLLDKIKFNIQYQGKNNTRYISRDRKYIKEANGNGFGTSISYDINKYINLSAAYFKSKRTEDQMRVDYRQFVNTDASAYALGFKIDSDNIYISSLYGRNYFVTPYGNVNNTFIRRIFEERSALRKYYYCGFAERVDNFEIVSKYKFKCGLQPSLSYFKSLAKNIKDIDENITNFVQLGLNYEPNDNLSTFIDYKINFIKNSLFTKKTNIETENALVFGFRFNF